MTTGRRSFGSLSCCFSPYYQRMMRLFFFSVVATVGTHFLLVLTSGSNNHAYWQSHRWILCSYILTSGLTDSLSLNIKWGLSLRAVPYRNTASEQGNRLDKDAHWRHWERSRLTTFSEKESRRDGRKIEAERIFLSRNDTWWHLWHICELAVCLMEKKWRKVMQKKSFSEKYL